MPGCGTGARIRRVMAPPALLGIDIGTSAAKGALLDPGGRVLAVAECPCGTLAPRLGWVEADAEGWWQATCRLARQLAAAAPGHVVAAVGVTGQAPTLLALDAAGRPIRPAILWLDLRAEVEASEIAARMGPDGEA